MLLITLEQLMGNNAINTEVPAVRSFVTVSSAYFIDLSNPLAQSGCSKLHKYEANTEKCHVVFEAVLSFVRAV